MIMPGKIDNVIAINIVATKKEGDKC